MQSEHIRERIKKFDNKLYLEFCRVVLIVIDSRNHSIAIFQKEIRKCGKRTTRGTII